MVLLGREGDSVSVSGLTSRSGRDGLCVRMLVEASPRFFQGVDERPFKIVRRESDLGTGVTFAEPGKPYG